MERPQRADLSGNSPTASECTRSVSRTTCAVCARVELGRPIDAFNPPLRRCRENHMVLRARCRRTRTSSIKIEINGICPKNTPLTAEKVSSSCEPGDFASAACGGNHVCSAGQFHSALNIRFDEFGQKNAFRSLQKASLPDLLIRQFSGATSDRCAQKDVCRVCRQFVP
jgi:hypothetical protein